MTLLIFKVLLQILAVGLAIVLAGLDYWWHDKRTRQFKRARKFFLGLAISFLVGSISLTIVDDITNRRREADMNAEISKVQKQNDGLQSGIATLTNKSSDILSEQRANFLSVLDDQRKIGLDTASRIGNAADLLHSKLAQSILKQQDLLKQQKTTLKTITGGDGFCYLGLSIDGNRAQLMLVPIAVSPLYDVKFTLYDVNENRSPIQKELGTVIPNVALMLDFIYLPMSDKQEFWILISARNGMLTESIKLRRVNGEWKTAYRVTKTIGKNMWVLFEKIDQNLEDQIRW